MPCDGPRMNPSVDVGNPPRPFRHLRMTERRTPDPSSSRVPVHSALVQKSVTVITNLVGRLSTWMLGKSRRMRKGKLQKRWQGACNQSNHARDSGLAMMSPSRGILPPKPPQQAGRALILYLQLRSASYNSRFRFLRVLSSSELLGCRFLRPITGSCQNRCRTRFPQSHSNLMQSGMRILRHNAQQIPAM